jgi:hypothetical protein
LEIFLKIKFRTCQLKKHGHIRVEDGWKLDLPFRKLYLSTNRVRTLSPYHATRIREERGEERRERGEGEGGHTRTPRKEYGVIFFGLQSALGFKF